VRPTPLAVRRLASPAFAAAALLAGCFSSSDGTSPPLDSLYFPVGLAVLGDAQYLAVANSDYDLHYNAGSLVVLDLEQIRARTGVPCSADTDCDAASMCDAPPLDGGQTSAPADHIWSYVCVDREGPYAGKPGRDAPERSLGERLVYPGRCQHLDLAAAGLLRDGVKIGAFATDVLQHERPTAGLDPDPNEAQRLFVPVRGDATLHWLSVSADGRLDCGQRGNSGACDDYHRVGDDPDQENARDLRLDPEPFAIASSQSGEAIVITNRTTGRVALFVNDWPSAPKLTSVLGGLHLFPVGIAALPPPAYATVPSATGELADSEYAPGFLVSFSNAAQIDLLRYFENGESETGPYLRRANASGIFVNSSGYDSRGIAVDASTRTGAETECATRFGVEPGSSMPPAGYRECLSEAAATPVDVYVANRAPASLVVGRTRPVLNAVETSEVPEFYDSIPLTLGPSRVLTGQVTVGMRADGSRVLEPRVFAVCFDSERIFVYDPARRRLETEIATGRGPHAIAIDPEHGLLYVAHFTDSYIGVVSIDRRHPMTYGKTLASIGQPTPPRTSK
jgi:hypothetical protein